MSKNLSENSQRLIVALDVSDFAQAKALIDQLSSEVNYFKIGLEAMMGGFYFDAIKYLKDKNKKIFADLKFYDIPQTVGKAVRNLAHHNVDMLTIHTTNHDIMRAAVENKGQTKLLGVTVLTSLDEKDLLAMGYDPKISLNELVQKKAALALEVGLDGVVASAMEAKMLRQNLGNDFLIVTPGIRINDTSDDQKRVVDVKTAIANGSSHLVVGRPITQSDNPLLAAKKFNELIM